MTLASRTPVDTGPDSAGTFGQDAYAVRQEELLVPLLLSCPFCFQAKTQAVNVLQGHLHMMMALLL